MRTILVAFVATLLLSAEAFGGGPAPYTEDAYRRIEEAVKKVHVGRKEGSLREENLKKMVDNFRAAFIAAGYDYDATIKKVIDDIRYRPQQVPFSGDSVPGFIFIGIHIMVSECNYSEVDCLRFFSQDTAEAIKWLSENTEFQI